MNKSDLKQAEAESMTLLLLLMALFWSSLCEEFASSVS